MGISLWYQLIGESNLSIFLVCWFLASWSHSKLILFAKPGAVALALSMVVQLSPTGYHQE